MHSMHLGRSRSTAVTAAGAASAASTHIYQMALEALTELAKEYSVRSPAKLYALSRKIGAPWTLAECREALTTSVPAQTLAPPPRSLGHSAAEGPGSRLQADLMDFNLNADGSHNDHHKYALQVSDVFTRKAYTEPLKAKNAAVVTEAMRKLLQKVPGHGQNAVVTTDAGGEFAGLDKVLPQGAAHREKQGVNDIAVVDRTMQTLKRDLEDKAQNYGTGWAHNLHEVTDNYNFRPNAAVHGSPDTAGDENAQHFFVLQDQSANFQHNRHLTLRRQGAIQQAGAYREPIHNGGRSFKPAYGDVHQFRRFMPGGGQVVDKRGNTALLKEVRAVGAASGEPKAHITFPKRTEKTRARGGQERDSLPGGEMPAPHVYPLFQEGGSSGSGGPAPRVAPPERFTSAQQKRQDEVSKHIMAYQPKVSEAERAARAGKKAAEEAAKQKQRDERLKAAAAKEAAKQRKQLERLMKQS